MGQPNPVDFLSDAFGEGCDARLAGLPLSANPYQSSVGHREWQRGWKDVNDFWGGAGPWPLAVPTAAACES